jgi:sugar phosphate isomerase/epimerase
MSLVPASLDRRRFLRAAAAVGAAGLTPNLFAFEEKKAEEKKPDEYGGFLLGAQSYTFRNFDLEPALKRIKDCNLHYVEFYQKHAPANATPEQIKALLKLAKDYDITPRCFGVQGFTKNHDANKKMFDFGAALGIKAFSADPDPDSFDSLDKLVAEYKIAIAIHPHGPAGGGKLHRWYGSEVILPAIKDHHPLIGTCLDTGHLIRAAQLGKKLDPAAEVRAMGARNFGIHLKDHDNDRKTDVIIGKGALNVPELIKALREVKFTYLISIEYEANPGEPTKDVQACVEVFKQAATKGG